MSRAAAERGSTIVELLVTLTIALVVLGAAMTALEVYQRVSATAEHRNDTQDRARSTMDELAFELRNVTAATAGSAGALEQAGPYALIFQTVDLGQVAGGLNATDHKRVRYCLDASTPSNEALWKQQQTWTTALAPAIPSTTACPDPAWPTRSLLVGNLTNKINGHDRPVFSFGPGASPTPAQASTVEADLIVDLSPGRPPGEAELTSGITLRNSNQPPLAAFMAAQANGHVLLNASTSSDPNGQALAYQWSLDGAAITGATAQQFDQAGLASRSTHVFSLTVSDLGGLTGSTTQTVVVQ